MRIITRDDCIIILLYIYIILQILLQKAATCHTIRQNACTQTIAVEPDVDGSAATPRLQKLSELAAGALPAERG